MKTNEPDTVPCKHCGREATMTRTQLCDQCWKVGRAMTELSTGLPTGLPTVMKIAESVFGEDAVDEYIHEQEFRR